MISVRHPRCLRRTRHIRRDGSWPHPAGMQSVPWHRQRRDMNWRLSLLSMPRSHASHCPAVRRSSTNPQNLSEAGTQAGKTFPPCRIQFPSSPTAACECGEPPKPPPSARSILIHLCCCRIRWPYVRAQGHGTAVRHATSLPQKPRVTLPPSVPIATPSRCLPELFPAASNIPDVWLRSHSPRPRRAEPDLRWPTNDRSDRYRLVSDRAPLCGQQSWPSSSRWRSNQEASRVPDR